MLENLFYHDMINALTQAKEECGYNATRCMQMLTRDGGVATAKKLIGNDSSKLTDGFSKMWANGKLDLTIEYLVLKPEYESLFTEEERQICRDRLKSCGYRFQ